MGFASFSRCRTSCLLQIAILDLLLHLFVSLSLTPLMILGRSGLLKQLLLQRMLFHLSHRLLSPSSGSQECLRVHQASSFLDHHRLLEYLPGTGSCRLGWTTTAYYCFHSLIHVSFDYLDAAILGSLGPSSVAQGESGLDRICSRGFALYFRTPIGGHSSLVAACTHLRHRRSFYCSLL